ncbi:hypothetical protein JQC67_02690 [Aurantibacter crassamenti]|uniref:DUF6804 family protein n=1 Tax=Aurantibacter crassamenti TaxID=1837375 RepID=UPI00193A42B2|nr:DUF6804 family protein [Aurantibacter crassamenti]MBM1105038.1 hypothetical protein [Aurantibacter crassamenti]
MLDKKTTHNISRIISVCCALLLLIALFHAPREYYWLLRTVVSIGALLVIIQNVTNPYWVVLFAIVLILFNPIFPIYLYKKLLWMPIDIIVGTLFLIEIIINRPKKVKVLTPTKKETKTYERDRTI